MTIDKANNEWYILKIFCDLCNYDVTNDKCNFREMFTLDEIWHIFLEDVTSNVEPVFLVLRVWLLLVWELQVTK